MINLLKGSLNLILSILLAAFAPVLAVRKAEGPQQRVLAIGIHVVAILLVIAGLIAIQWKWQIDSFVRSSLPVIRFTWLPLVGTLGYATTWSIWFVARTLRLPTEKPLFDSVASSLRDGLDRLSRAGIRLEETPIFLVLGSPAEGVREFFAASNTDLVVPPPSDESDEPIQVCGNRDAIYICCQQASLLGNYAYRATKLRSIRSDGIEGQQAGVERLNHEQPWRGGQTSFAEPVNSAPAQDYPDINGSSGGTATATVPAATATTTSLMEGDPTAQRVHQTITQIETLTAPELTEQASPVLQPRTKKQTILQLDAVEAAEILERLETVCRELVELRQPYCPINGVVMLVPLDSADHIEKADHVGMRMERDLNTIAKATETSLSTQVIFCDLDRCEGSQVFLDRFPDNQRDRRLGAILPAPPASEPDAGATGIDRAVRWICEDLFPPLGYRLMKRNGKNQSQDRNLKHGNQQIQHMIQSMRQRSQGMSRMLRRGIATGDGKIRIRGCFVAATGSSGPSKQAFAEGVIPLIHDLQNEVQWSSSRRGRDRWQRFAAIATYTGVVISTGITLVLLLGVR